MVPFVYTVRLVVCRLHSSIFTRTPFDIKYSAEHLEKTKQHQTKPCVLTFCKIQCIMKSFTLLVMPVILILYVYMHYLQYAK